MSTKLNQAQPENVTFSHSLTITDFSMKLTSSVEHQCISSSVFPSTSTSTKSTNQFQLSLFPKGIEASFSDCLSIGLGAVSAIGNDEKITVRYGLSLINSEGERRNTKEWLHVFSSSKRIFTFGSFISRSELLDPSNGFILDDKLVIYCEITVLDEPTALDYANTNLPDLKFIAKSQPDLMVEMLYNLATKHRLTYYSPEEIPNFEIQNQMEETFSYTYKAKLWENLFFTWSQSKYIKSTLELKLLSCREILNLLSFLMESGKHADLSLVLQGDQKKVLNLHKIVLLNRSSAFDVLLHNIVENQNSQVAISDVPIEVFELLIHYLYTGKVPLLKKYQYELLNVSCEYGFDVLNQMCQLALCDQITTENAIHLLNYASSVSYDLLKRACIEHITDHATEFMFDLDLIEEMYRNLVLKNALKESEDRHVYANLQLKVVSDRIEESTSYTRLKMCHYPNNAQISSIYCPLMVAFKFRPQINVLCGILVVELSSIRGLSQLELAQSRKHLFECMNSWLRKYGDDQEKLSSLHAILLFNRSSAFGVLLNEIVEKLNSKVFSGDVSSEVFNQLIHYLYTGKVPLLMRYKYELLDVSCEYGFEVLKQMCELILCNQITNENVINALGYADSISADLLKRACLEYLNAKDVIKLVLSDLDSLKLELIGELYSNLALKSALNEVTEDRLVYEHFQLSALSNGIEESLSYTRLKIQDYIFNESTFYFNESYGQPMNNYIRSFNPLIQKSRTFSGSGESTFKFKLIKLPPVDSVKHKSDFELMVKDNDPFLALFEPQVSLIRYRMTLFIYFYNEHADKLVTCDDSVLLNVSSNFTRLGNKLSLPNPDQLVRHYRHNRFVIMSGLLGQFWSEIVKIHSEITVFCGISALDLSPIRGLSQLELEQSRKHLFECMNSLLLKSDDGKQCDVTLVVRGIEFKVHSLFLAQSPVLEVLVAQSKRINISNLSIEAFEQLLQYLYTGKVQSLDKYAKELWIVASKYKLEMLTQMCNHALNQFPVQTKANGNSRIQISN